MAKEIIKDVPKEMVPEVVNSFEQQGCTVDSVEQDNGLYTIIANCPDTN